MFTVFGLCFLPGFRYLSLVERCLTGSSTLFPLYGRNTLGFWFQPAELSLTNAGFYIFFLVISTLTSVGSACVQEETI